ncbi:hypothetical protein [Arthrobacter sp. 92]|uniref:hypothetical protein n=1 Tax=Arthrobacter sp. 92 TaxID=3418175 RepID=UPI003D062F81
MNTSTRHRVDKGAPTTNTNFVAHRLGECGFAGHVSVEEIPQVTAELNASPAFRDENITAVKAPTYSPKDMLYRCVASQAR